MNRRGRDLKDAVRQHAPGVAAMAAGGAIGFLAARWALRRLGRYDFRDRTVLITGGSRGLGLVLARRLLAERARVVICARDADELRRAADSLGPCGDLWTARCDITRKGQVDDMVEQVEERIGPVDVLINNAGIIQVGPVESFTDSDFHTAINTHIWGPLNTVNAVLPAMRARRDGRIVNISSIGGRISLPHMLPYCTSKFGLVGLSDGLRTELSQDGIIVTTVCPGLIRTGSQLHAEFKGHHEAEYRWFSVAASLPLLAMEVEDAAERIIDACRYGDARLTLTLPAKAAALGAQLAPNLTSSIMRAANHFLPHARGEPGRSVKGFKATAEGTSSWMTRSVDRAARRNNEVPAEEDWSLDD